KIGWTTGVAPDIIAPRVIGTINANGATNVAINAKEGATFSEAMDPLTITNLTFTLKQGTTDVPGTVSYSGVNAVFTPTSTLAPSTTYTATITTGAKDLAGNALAALYVWSWTTAAAADTTPPTVILVNPANLAIDVPINTAVNATFSEAMDPLSVSTASFTLQVSGPPLGPILTATVDYDALSHIATLTPSVKLTNNTQYTATVTNGVKDLAGNAMVSNYVWTFTTATAGSALAPGAVPLGSASTFGIMATSAITNTGLSTINGDVSLDPGTSMTGFPPGVVNGAIHINDTVSAKARADLLVAYNFAKGLAPGTTISAGADLGALYPSGIAPGTYTSGSTMLVSTPLKLDAGGNANAVWVFQIGSSLTTGASVSLANGAQAKNVFWVPTSDATIGVGTIFYGTIVAGRDVTAVTGATVNGRILSGAITAGTIALQTSTVNVPAP
ncbi:MAG: Ig-like domain-containing protein, partial [Proteobacteria bacterium]|nr:Ig-like domain-containing protein [Pseudomonadota bacterium]